MYHIYGSDRNGGRWEVSVPSIGKTSWISNTTKADIIDFINVFGEKNIDLYISLRSLKEDGEFTWNDIKNIQLSDINFANKNVCIPQEILELNKLKNKTSNQKER